MLADFRGQRVVLFQGPNGPFFRRLGAALREVGAEVTKVNLNAADQLFYPGPNAISFRGELEEFSAFVEKLLHDTSATCVFLFGEFRPYHEVARAMVDRLGLELFVVEEGYLRPDHITIERGGVNVNSSMPRTPDGYASAPDSAPRVHRVRHAFAWSVWFTILNSLAITCFWFLYPHYRHHRDVSTARQALLWGRGFWRRLRHRASDRATLEQLVGPLSKHYFLVALQVHNDYQVTRSPFGDVEVFVREVVSSFARHAREDDVLVVKHHPADRAYRDYTQLLAGLAEQHGIIGRVFYVLDPHLPTLLRHARGTVVINSTVGLSSVLHGTPVKPLGVAVYEWMGLAASCSLEEFWQAPPPVDKDRFERARRYLLHENQANGSIWTKLPGAGTAGIYFPPRLAPRAGGRSETSRQEFVVSRDERGQARSDPEV